MRAFRSFLSINLMKIAGWIHPSKSANQLLIEEIDRVIFEIKKAHNIMVQPKVRIVKDDK